MKFGLQGDAFREEIQKDEWLKLSTIQTSCSGHFYEIEQKRGELDTVFRWNGKV